MKQAEIVEEGRRKERKPSEIPSLLIIRTLLPFSYACHSHPPRSLSSSCSFSVRCMSSLFHFLFVAEPFRTFYDTQFPALLFPSALLTVLSFSDRKTNKRERHVPLPLHFLLVVFPSLFPLPSFLYFSSCLSSLLS